MTSESTLVAEALEWVAGADDVGTHTPAAVLRAVARRIRESRDARTPGRVAWRVFYGGLHDDWDALSPEQRSQWESAAAAVLAHGRGR